MGKQININFFVIITKLNGSRVKVLEKGKKDIITPTKNSKGLLPDSCWSTLKKWLKYSDEIRNYYDFYLLIIFVFKEFIFLFIEVFHTHNSSFL